MTLLEARQILKKNGYRIIRESEDSKLAKTYYSVRVIHKKDNWSIPEVFEEKDIPSYEDAKEIFDDTVNNPTDYIDNFSTDDYFNVEFKKYVRKPYCNPVITVIDEFKMNGSD